MSEKKYRRSRIPQKIETPDFEKTKVSTLSSCGKFASMWVCENDETHKVARVLDCNREWCEKCRESAHNRRIAKLFPKMMKIEKLAMLTVTFPHDKRLRTQRQFSRIGRLITEALQRRRFSRGFRRWHWFGDSLHGMIPEYHPHVHFLAEARYLTPNKLRDLKRVIRRIIGVENAVIHYQFTDSVRKIIHWIKYVTRPTFLEQKWDYDLAEELYNFRNSVSWGKWDDEDKWNPLGDSEGEKWDFLVKVHSGVCPVCGGCLKWLGIGRSDELVEKGYDEVYLKIWSCGCSPLLSQNFNLLKEWSRAFGGFDSCDKRVLDDFFRVLNSGGDGEDSFGEEGARVTCAEGKGRSLKSLSGRFFQGGFGENISTGGKDC
ncbi:hypothetical protein ES703_77941 [subsurface metagenome]